MAAIASNARHSAPPSHDFGFAAIVPTSKWILNGLRELAATAADRSRFASLPRRYLDDVGITVAERAATLRYEEPAFGAWQAIVTR